MPPSSRHEQQEADGDLDFAERRVGAKRVDALLDEAGPEDGEAVAHDDEGQPGGVGSAIAPEVGKEGPQLVHRSLGMSSAQA